jgi:hypothetical protein
MGVSSLRYGLNEIMRLRPVTWNWKNDSDRKTQLGLIAQDVETILPELVVQGTDKDQMLSLNYIGLLPVVIKAIQEQQATIAMLRNEIAALRRPDRNLVSEVAAYPRIESSGTTNTCSGNVTTDANGDATIMLPDDFEALHLDFRYQLTVIGQFAQAIISSEIANNRFRIKTDKPGVQVSWQVVGTRRDSREPARPGRAD